MERWPSSSSRGFIEQCERVSFREARRVDVIRLSIRERERERERERKSIDLETRARDAGGGYVANFVFYIFVFYVFRPG